jgi:hypothetical protein
MAKRQQQADFLPTKALQPQQQIFDQYNAPKQFQAPQSELMEIGSALAGLSPTLQKFEDRDRAEDAAAMEIAASKMSIDELRAASKRDFIGLQQSGAIPEGASPWAKVALLEAAGKRLVSQTVLPELYKNLDRLSDPNNNESPEQFARSIMDKQGIDSLYAANAAEQALQPVIAQFSNRVGESKAKRTATHNRDDLTDSIYEISQTFQLGKPSEQAAVITKLQEQLDNAHTNLGISGRNEAWSGISEAAKEMTRNGNYEGAMELLDSVGSMTVGGRAFGKDFAADIDELEDDLETISLQEEDLEFQRENQRRTTRIRTISDVTGALVYKKGQEGNLLDDPISMMSEIETMLTAQGVEAGDIPAMTAEVMKQYRTFQPLGEGTDDKKTVAALRNMLLDDAMSYDTFASNVETAILSGAVTPNTGFSLKATGKKTKDEISLRDELQRQTSSVYGTGLSSIRAAVQRDTEGLAELDDEEIFAITTDYTSQYNDIVRRVTADITLDQTAKIDKINEETEKIALQTLNTIRTGDVPEGATDVQRETTEQRRARQVGLSAPAKALDVAAAAERTYWDSIFTDLQEDYLEADEEARPAIAKKVYAGAQKVVDEFRTRMIVSGGKEIRFTGEPKYRSDYLRAKAITGLSLEEITNVALTTKEDWVGRTVHRTESGQLELPKDMLNPRHVVLVEGIESAQALRDMASTPAGNAKLNEIYDALAKASDGEYAVGQEAFIEFQFKLLQRVR